MSRRRAELSFTHRHLCEFTGLDFEMAINESYEEVLDVVDKLFVTMFDGLNKQHGAHGLGAELAHGLNYAEDAELSLDKILHVTVE